VRLSDRSFARRIDITSLQLFVAVCELGSIGKAAEREAIAGSAASKRLSELEATVGAPLLYRHPRGVDLTPAGQTLLHHARSMLLSLQKMQGELSEYGDGVRGHIRVHANISSIVQFLPEDLGTFAKLHPQVKIEMEEHLSADIVRAVQEGATDLGICSSTVLAPDHGLQTLPYRQDELVLIAPRTHALARRKTITFESTLDFDHVGLHDNSSISVAMRQAAAAVGRQVRLRIQVTSLDAMCRMIENGLGIGVMPRRAYELVRSPGGLACISLDDPWVQRKLDLVARDFDALPITARQLVEHLRARSSAQADAAPKRARRRSA
jgi:DNA-binding transcriptional LysR family regulator